VFFITGYFKISLHTLAFGGVVGAILGLYRAHGFMDYSVLAFAILALGVIASARLILNAHSPKEVNSGAVLGVFILYLFSAYTLYL
jgi:membrane-associated phospholipid phosphatase